MKVINVLIKYLINYLCKVAIQPEKYVLYYFS